VHHVHDDHYKVSLHTTAKPVTGHRSEFCDRTALELANGQFSANQGTMTLRAPPDQGVTIALADCPRWPDNARKGVKGRNNNGSTSRPQGRNRNQDWHRRNVLSWLSVSEWGVEHAGDVQSP